MLPLLHFAADGNEHSLREAIEDLAEKFGLTNAEKKELLPSGQQPTFDNRVAWARTYMNKAALLESTRRGYFRITQRGREVLSKNPAELNVKFLEQYPEFIEFRAKHNEPKEAAETTETENLQTPGELLESAYQKLREDLSAELLKTVRECSPAFFERLVIDVLVKMGYGGSTVSIRVRWVSLFYSGVSEDGNVDHLKRLDTDNVWIQTKLILRKRSLPMAHYFSEPKKRSVL